MGHIGQLCSADLQAFALIVTFENILEAVVILALACNGHLHLGIIWLSELT